MFRKVAAWEKDFGKLKWEWKLYSKLFSKWIYKPAWPTTNASGWGWGSGSACSLAPTTTLWGSGGDGSPEKKVACACLERGFGARWWLVDVRLETWKYGFHYCGGKNVNGMIQKFFRKIELEGNYTD